MTAPALDVESVSQFGQQPGQQSGSGLGNPSGPATQPRQPRPRRRWRLSERVVLVIPAVSFVVVMMILPVLFTIGLSLTRWSGGRTQDPVFVGLKNYRRLLEDDRFSSALYRTIMFTVVAVAIETFLGVAIAVLLNREFAARGIVRTLFLLPMVATPVAIALVWRLMYEPNVGVLNKVLSVGGISSEFVARSDHALWWLLVVDVWQWTSIIILIVASTLAAQPSDVYEAAAIDGSSPWQTFWRITLPMIRPAIITAMVFRMIDALKTFDIIWVITQGGPGFATETLNLYIYKQNFEAQNLGYAASMLNIFFAIVVTAAVILLRFRKRSNL
jgi:multiple sugar transport system permease protein